jgi:hypothetical protein
MAVRARATSLVTGPARCPVVQRQPTLPERPGDGRGARRVPSGISARSTPRPRDAGNLGRGKSLQPEGDGSELARIRASQTAVLRLPLGLIGHSPTPCFRLSFRLLAGVFPFDPRRPTDRGPDMGQASISSSVGQAVVAVSATTGRQYPPAAVTGRPEPNSSCRLRPATI